MPKQKSQSALELLVAPDPPALSLEQRAEALIAEVLKAPADTQEQVVAIWQDAIEKHLGDEDEQRRPKMEGGAIPKGWLTTLWFRAGAGCHCRALLASQP